MGFIDQPIITWGDMAFIIICGIVLITIRKLLTDYIFFPIADRLNITDPKGRSKFAENSWYAIYYPILLVTGYFVLIDKSWFPFRSSAYFRFDSYDDWTTYPEIRYYYLVQTAFYAQGMATLIYWDTRRSDFIELCLHHIFTLVLLFGSFMSGQHRIGTNVLFLHDIADVFLYSAKVAHYIFKFGKRPWVENVVNVLFVFFAISFFTARLYLYPRFVIYDGYAEETRKAHYGYTYHVKYESTLGNSFFLIDEKRMCFFNWCLSPHIFLLSFMTLLAMLHVFWGALILRMIYNTFFVTPGKVGPDIRSSEEEDKAVDYDKIDEQSNGHKKTD